MTTSRARSSRQQAATQQAADRKRLRKEAAAEKRAFRRNLNYLKLHLKAIDGHRGFAVEFYTGYSPFGEMARLSYKKARLGNVYITKRKYRFHGSDEDSGRDCEEDRFMLASSPADQQPSVSRSTKEDFIEALADFLARFPL